MKPWLRGVGLGLLSWLAVSAVTKSASALERAEEPQNLAGARVGVEGTPLASLYYARFGRGLWQPRAQTELEFTSALLTGLSAGRLRVERHEPLVRTRGYALLAVVGTGFAFAHDGGGSYRSWSGLLGLRATRALGVWELGARLAYLPSLVTRVGFSADLRDTYRDRYPDARDERGPASATLWLPGQRLQALLAARALWSTWALDLTAGLQWSPLAGRDLASLEQGQLPILLQIGLARRF